MYQGVKKIVYPLLLQGLLLVACNTEYKKNKKDCLYNVNNNCLDKKDIVEISENLSPQDSAVIVSKYIDDWLFQNELYNEAKDNTLVNEEELDKRINELKRQYYNSQYINQYVKENLDTAFSNKEILDYYNLHKEQFKLSSNIIKLFYVKLADNEKDIAEFKKNLKNITHGKNTLNTFVAAKASGYFINDSLWLKWEDVTKEIPTIKNYSGAYFTPGKLIEWKDGKYYYYLRIIDFKVKDEYSPVVYEKNKIKTILTEQRKQALVNALRIKILEKVKAKQK